MTRNIVLLAGILSLGLFFAVSGVFAEGNVSDIDIESMGNLSASDYNEKVSALATDQDSVRLQSLPNGSYNYDWYARQQVNSSDELKVTRVENNGSSYNDGQWPDEYSDAGKQWNSLFQKYNLVSLDSDPFAESDALSKSVSNLACSQIDTYNIYRAYTVYLTLGNRKFICFISVDGQHQCYTWRYELK